MGADGHIVICKRADFEAANPAVPPSWLHLYEGEFLGMECLWGYYGDNLYGSNYLGVDSYANYPISEAKCYESGGFRDYTPDELDRLTRAVQWFESHAESHEVWT